MKPLLVLACVVSALVLAGQAAAARHRVSVEVSPLKRLLIAVALLATFAASGCGGSEGEGQPSATDTATTSDTAAAAKPLKFVALGDSWPEGAHCGGCRTFAGLYADGLKARTGRAVTFIDLTGQAQPFFDTEGGGTASLLHALHIDSFQKKVASGHVIMIATGPNEVERAFKPYASGKCGRSDNYACVKRLEDFWRQNFAGILDEIDRFRGGRPTVIRLVSAANFFVSDPSATKGLPPDAMTFGEKLFKALNDAVCDTARAHNANCVDVRRVLNGPTFDQRVDENSTASMKAVADALLATGIDELPE